MSLCYFALKHKEQCLRRTESSATGRSNVGASEEPSRDVRGYKSSLSEESGPANPTHPTSESRFKGTTTTDQGMH